MQLPGRKKPSDEQKTLRRALKQLDSALKHQEEVVRRKDNAASVYWGTTNPDHNRARDLSDPKDWMSRLFPKVAFEHAELSIAELCDGIPEFEADPRLPEYGASAAAAERAVNYYLERDNFARTYRRVMRRAVKYGDCPVKIIWKRDVAQERVVEVAMQPVIAEDGLPALDPYGQPALEPVEVERVVEHVLFDGPTIIPLDYKDFAHDPSGGSIQECRHVWHRWRATIEDLEVAVDDDGNPLYHNLDELRKACGGDDATDTKRDNETQEQFEARTTGVITIWERWTDYGVLAVANRTTIIRHDEDPHDPIFRHRKKPFGIVRLIEDDDNIGGVSKMLLIDQPQEAFWKCLNELMNAITLRTRPPKVADTESDPNAANQVIYPDATLYSRNGDATLKIYTDIAALDITGMQNLLVFLRDIMERTTGMNAQVAGLANSSSATESSNNLQQSKGRTRFELQTSDDDWGDIIEMVFQLIQQNADREIVAEVAGGEPISFAPEDLTGQYQFKSKLASDRVLREQRLNSLTTLFSQIMPLIQPGTVEFEQVSSIIDQMCDLMDVSRLGVQEKSAAEAQMEQGQIQLQLEAQSMQQQADMEAQQMMMQQQLAPPDPGVMVQ